MVHESNGSYYAVIFSSQRTEGITDITLWLKKWSSLRPGNLGF